MRANRAVQKAKALHQKLGLQGQVDVEAVANILGLTVILWRLNSLQELMVDDCIGVAERLSPVWRRWVIAHALGHWVLHPGNHLWMRMRTGLASKVEREAEDFAHALLIDPREAMQRGFMQSWEIAEYFGVPEEQICLQGLLDLS